MLDKARREVLGKSLDFLEEASQEELEDYLAAVQDTLCGDSNGGRDGDGELPVAKPPSGLKRGENDGSGTR